jgi:hypothetical protein
MSVNADIAFYIVPDIEEKTSIQGGKERPLGSSGPISKVILFDIEKTLWYLGRYWVAKSDFGQAQYRSFFFNIKEIFDYVEENYDIGYDIVYDILFWLLMLTAGLDPVMLPPMPGMMIAQWMGMNAWITHINSLYHSPLWQECWDQWSSSYYHELWRGSTWRPEGFCWKSTAVKNKSSNGAGVPAHSILNSTP